MITRTQSGPLEWAEVKGLHCVIDPWSIDLGDKWRDRSFRLLPYNNPHGVTATPNLTTRLDSEGILMVVPGYLWDGSSGPTIDGAADPVPSLVHDALYEAMRARRLHTRWRAQADALYRDMLRERGMGVPRAWMRWAALRLFGGSAASRNRGPEYPRRVSR